MIVNLNIIKKIKLPELVLSNQKKISNSVINEILYEIKEQIQGLFKEKILVRERLIKEDKFCSICRRSFPSNLAIRMHYIRIHFSEKEKQLFLSSHIITISKEKTRYLYFILENPDAEIYKNQVLFRIKL